MLSVETRAAIDAVARILLRSQRVLSITGAGLSADSGLPTYRGIGGLYGDERTTEEGYAIEELLSGPMFVRRPELVWKYLLQIEERFRHARPNRGHEVLAAIGRAFPGAWILTQNVDGLHEAAGSRDVIDIHGDVHTLLCTRCTWHAQVENYAHLEPLPRCPSCNAVVRPNVVLFGEMLDPVKTRLLQDELELGFDVVLSIGTSSLFPYITMPVIDALRMGIPTVEVNPDETDLSHEVDHRIQAPAAEALGALWQRYLELRSEKKGA